MGMKNIALAAIAVGFFGLIGFACWVTGSAWPLLALLFTPTIKLVD